MNAVVALVMAAAAVRAKRNSFSDGTIREVYYSEDEAISELCCPESVGVGQKWWLR